MKITGPGSVTPSAPARRKAGGGKDGFSVETGAETRATAPAAGASALASVDAILALQGVGDFKEAKKRATERAFSLLDVLDDLKLALLEGGVPRHKLVALMDALKTRREGTNDSRLEAVLDEVETRAAVELAKHQG
ncbi:MAG: flagellar biosynthesis protein FlgI [Maricaulaceae bacterium]|nr:flagellar biosynthesis protein FlgI [Maricaulaceae bacterium]